MFCKSNIINLTKDQKIHILLQKIIWRVLKLLEGGITQWVKTGIIKILSKYSQKKKKVLMPNLSRSWNGSLKLVKLGVKRWTKLY